MRDRSFYFRGPAGRHNLKAQNLVIVSQIAEGIDEETWLFHLHRGDYSRWFREAVKDSYLADHAERIEQRQDLRPAETRELMRSFMEGRYTLPEYQVAGRARSTQVPRPLPDHCWSLISTPRGEVKSLAHF